MYRQSCDDGLALGQIDVDFATDAEIPGQVDPWLDGKAGLREKTPLVLGLKVVDVGAVAMDFLADRMAGAVDKPVAVAGFRDDSAADVVYFASAGKSPGCHFLL